MPLVYTSQLQFFYCIKVLLSCLSSRSENYNICKTTKQLNFILEVFHDQNAFQLAQTWNINLSQHCNPQSLETRAREKLLLTQKQTGKSSEWDYQFSNQFSQIHIILSYYLNYRLKARLCRIHLPLLWLL